MIQIQKFTFNPFQENTYVLFDESRAAIIIDPGCYTRQEENELVDFIEKNELKIELLLNTHGHIDHVLGNDFIKRKYGLLPIIHKEDLPILHSISNYGESFGIKAIASPEPSDFMEDKDEMQFGNSNLKVIHVPGHSPGHIALYNEEQKFIIGGDILFYGSIGRTDLPMGDHDALIKNIHEKLLVLDEDIRIHPGHGPSTTIGFEKNNNPFLQDN